MPSIDDLLNNLGADVSDQSEKTASDNSHQSEVAKQAQELGLIGDKAVQNEKTASISNDGGTKMNLNDYYNDLFTEDVEKTASAEFETEDYEMAKEAQGELAGLSFSEELESRLIAHSIKLASDMAQPDSEATKDIQSGAGVIPGAQTANPQLPVQKNRHGESDDTGIDTSPEYYDLEGMDGAVAKAKLEAALDKGNVSDMSHKTVNVESEMPEGGSQKEASIRLSDLTKEELDLLQTDFPEEMMKEAYAIVEEEQEKIAEMHQTASDCYEFGADLAMQKIAEMEAKAKEKEEEDEDEEDSDEEKTASAMGKFITEGYWDTLMEKGAEYYGDENIYIEELIKEANLLSKGKKMLSNLKKNVKDYYDPRAIKAKSNIPRKQEMMKNMKGNVMGDASKRRAKLEAIKKKKGKDYSMKGSKAVETAKKRKRNTAIAGGSALGLGGAGLGYAAGRD
jgi:hypothetical protein